MSTPRSSVLVPLYQKPSATVSNMGLLNPVVGTSLSSTPSPTATPSFTRSLESLANDKSSPTLSSNLVKSSVLPLIDVGKSAPPSPSFKNLPPLTSGVPLSSSVKSATDLGSLPPSPSSPLPKLSGLPALSSLGGGSTYRMGTPSALPALSSPSTDKLPPSPVKTSMSGLNSPFTPNKLPPSPVKAPLSQSAQSSEPKSYESKSSEPKSSEPFSACSLGKSGFSSTSNGSPISLPKIPLTSVPDSNLKPLSSSSTKVEDDSLSTASFHDQQGMIMEDEVEKSLTESGYLTVDKILTKDENGNLLCQYIKAVDATGRSAFVDLDCEGYVAVDPKDMTMTNSSSVNASVVPYSVKMGTYECVSSDVCGVAFECDNEICTLKRTDQSLTPSETVFTTLKSGNGDKGMLSNTPIAYPIVSLSDLKANPEQVASSIKDSHNRMRNVAFGQANRDTENLVNATKSFNAEIKRFDTNQRLISTSLNKTINELERIHAQYKRSPPASDKERANLRSVQYNLRKRHDLVVDFIKLSESVNDRTDRVKELAGEVKSLNDYAEKLFAGLDGVYQE